VDGEWLAMASRSLVKKLAIGVTVLTCRDRNHTRTLDQRGRVGGTPACTP